MYIYIYILNIYIYIIHLFILLINIVTERNEKKKNFKQNFSNLLVGITFSLANCELNYTPFWCIWGICTDLRKLLKQISQLIDLTDQQKLKL